jgi:chemotaxis protein CheZ
MSGDSPELEALFDSIAEAQTEVVKPARPAASTSGDTPELEALFDSISAAVTQEATGVEGQAVCPEHVFAQVGHMTRSLHNLLRELGYDSALEKVKQQIPDNRDRLNYIAAMTAQAAERTLNAAEAAQPIQNQLGASARQLADGWDKLFNKQLGVEEFKALVRDTRGYLRQVPEQVEATNSQLLEIIMAQDFQDLTGQVIKKVLEAAQVLESQLVSLLIETTPQDLKQQMSTGLLNGPVVNTAGRGDVVTNQEQVDELLESLGF